MIVSFDNLLMSLLGAPLSVSQETGTHIPVALIWAFQRSYPRVYMGEEHDASDSY